MRFVIQRVKEACVRVDSETIGEIGKGYLVLVGVSDSDTEQTADKMIRKMIGLRIFEDDNGKNKSFPGGCGWKSSSCIPVYAVCKLQERKQTEFHRSRRSGKGKRIYEYVIRECKKSVPDVQTGSFGAEMEVSLTNDGPFTILLDSEKL